MTHWIAQVGVAAALLFVLGVAFAIGRRLGRRHPDEHSQLGVIQGATLGLMGLLLGFSYSGAMTRFDERQRLILHEANAIGTVWLRSELLPEDAKSKMRERLRGYALGVLEGFADPGAPKFAEAMERTQRDEEVMWAIVVAEVSKQPAPAREVMQAVNEMFDLRADRAAATRRHMPMFVLMCLVVCAALSVGTIGYGLAGGRQALVPPAMALIVLMTVVLWVVLDMDYPRYGFIRVSDEPLRGVIAVMRE